MPKLTEQTLAEQLNITPHEVEYRKHLFNFTDNDVRTPESCRPFFERHADAIASQFYARQVENDEIDRVIGDADTLQRLHTAFARYILELCCGVYDQAYVNRRLHIGKVHRRMGVSPKLYMSSIRLLQDLLEEMLEAHAGESWPGDQLKSVKSALHKILFLDAQFVFDAYIDSFILEVDSVKTEVEGYAHSLQMTVSPGNRQLREISSRDSLTRLYNHRSFNEFMARELATAQRHRLPLCLVYFDLNGFKKINDTEGHEAGNQILINVGKALVESLRQIDIPCRYGGDEFCLILPRTELKAAKMLCHRFIERFEARSNADVSFSFGITQAGPDEFAGLSDMLRMTDRLMYKAKDKSHRDPGSHIRTAKLTSDPDGERDAA